MMKAWNRPMHCITKHAQEGERFTLSIHFIFHSFFHFRRPMSMANVQGNSGPVWESKIEKAVFRGMDSNVQRLNLIMTRRKMSELYDVGLSRTFYHPYDEEKYGPHNRISFFDFFKVSFLGRLTNLPRVTSFTEYRRSSMKPPSLWSPLLSEAPLSGKPLPSLSEMEVKWKLDRIAVLTHKVVCWFCKI